jgi:hypothetical protein
MFYDFSITNYQLPITNYQISRRTHLKRYLLITSLIFLLIHFFSTPVFSQEHHYWSNQFGSRSALMGGAVVGGVRDTSAGYYNPGALGFIKQATFSASGNGYQVESVDISHGAGTGLDIDSFNTNIVPLLISGTVMWEGHAFGYSLVTKNSSDVKMSGRMDKQKDVLPFGTLNISELFKGDEDYRAQFTYDSHISETWGGLSWAYQVRDNISVGISGFLALRRQSFNATEFARAANIESGFIANEDAFLNADFYNVRGLLKFGMAADFGALKLGATMTTPSLSLFGKGTVAGGSGQFKEDESIGFILDDRQEDLDAEYKTPFSLALGLEYAINPTTRIAGTIEWFAKQNHYNVITPRIVDMLVGSRERATNDDLSEQEANEIGNRTNLNSREILALEDKAEKVTNFALAIEHAFHEKLTGYFSFRTDFTTFPGYNDNVSYDKMGINNWDIYHITFGIARTRKMSMLAVGLTYSFGSQDNFEPLAQINPDDRNREGNIPDFLLADSDSKASADYRALGLIVGYTYFFK